MNVFPAIDILDGKVVRLRQGRYDEVTVYDDDPLAQAERFADAGAEWVHVVDLDGARSGEPANIEHVQRIAAESGLWVQTGGGIRSLDTLKRLFAAGVERCVLGTSLVRQPEMVRQACLRYGDAIVAGVDARDGEVALEGWREGSRVRAEELVRELESYGVRRVVYTDITRDGMQQGVNADAYRSLLEMTPIAVIASGGVATLDDIRALSAVGGRLEGVIVGRALYEGAFTLAEAIDAAQGPGAAGAPPEGV